MKSETTKKILNLILNILIVVFSVTLLISIYTSVQTKVLNNKYADFFGYSVFEVKTGSMSGTIEIGDWIVVNLTNKVALNDIVTYEQNGEYITHRIIEAYSGTFVTMGDANTAKDDPIDQSQIIGKVVKILPNFGIFRKTIFNPIVLISLIVTLFLFDLAFKKGKKEKVEEEPELKVKTKEKQIVSKDNKVKEIFDKVSNKVKDLIDNIKFKISEKKLVKTKVKEEKPVPEEVVVTQINEVKEEVKPYYDFSDYTEEDNKVEETELEKTSLYRFVPVDMAEVDETFLEIAKAEMEEAENKTKLEETKEVEEIVEEVVEEKPLDKINLKLLNSEKLKKKSKNVIDKMITIKTEEINEIVKSLVERSNDPKEREIKDLFITTYLQARYYNYFGNDELEYNGKNLIIKIERFITSITKEIKEKYDKKYSDEITNYANAMLLITNLEDVYDKVKEVKAKQQYYKKEMIKYFKSKKWDNAKYKFLTDKILDIQKSYDSIINYIFKKFETNTFELNLVKTSKKDTLIAELKHNITFSKMYSDYIIDKTYGEGIIAENKMNILMTLLCLELAKDMLNGDFNKKYIIYVPESLYEKDRKFNAILDLFDDEYAKNNVMVLVPYEKSITYDKLIKKNIKDNYHFALVFDERGMEVKDVSEIYLYDYIFVNKKDTKTIEKLLELPDEVEEKVLYENITDKISDFEVGD